MKGTRLPPGIGVLSPFNGPNADEVRRIVTRFHRTLVHCGMRTDTVLCIGTGRNAACFNKLNERLGLFECIIALEHPR